MPSSWSSSLRFELQFTGENINLWGDKLNVVLNHVDFATAGFLVKALTGNYALSTANAADDEARAASIKFTGAGPFVVTIPSVPKHYNLWNGCAGAVTITTGSGTTITLLPGEIAPVLCDGGNVNRVLGLYFGSQQITGVADPTSPQGVATKAYADALAFTANAGNLPAQAGSAGKFIKTNGATAAWASIATADLSDIAAYTAAQNAFAIASAIAL
jgi:hypothetical protein